MVAIVLIGLTMRVLLWSAMLLLVAADKSPTPPASAPSGVQYPPIMRLLFSSVGDKGTDFVAFARVPAVVQELLQQRSVNLYCLRLTKDRRDWSFFTACGKLALLFGSTLKISGFPDIGKIDEVLSARPLRFRKAVTLAISNIDAKNIPQAPASSTRNYIQNHLNTTPQSIFIGIELLRYGRL